MLCEYEPYGRELISRVIPQSMISVSVFSSLHHFGQKGNSARSPKRGCDTNPRHRRVGFFLYGVKERRGSSIAKKHVKVDMDLSLVCLTVKSERNLKLFLSAVIWFIDK